MAMSVYDVKATLVGKSWHVEVPAIGRSTQARNHAEIGVMAADLIEIMTGEAPEALTVQVQVPAEVQSRLDEADRLKETEAAARREAAVQYRLAAMGLKSSGLTLRDIGAVLGVSHQRAAQLLEAS